MYLYNSQEKQQIQVNINVTDFYYFCCNMPIYDIIKFQICLYVMYIFIYKYEYALCIVIFIIIKFVNAYICTYIVNNVHLYINIHSRL